MSIPQSSIPAGMSDRAAIALLTLRLRTIEKELVDAQSAEAAIDVDTARGQLRAKLAPLEAQRRAALDDALEQARQDADTAVENARRRVAEIHAAHSVSTSAAVVADVTPTSVVEPVEHVEHGDDEPETVVPDAVLAPSHGAPHASGGSTSFEMFAAAAPVDVEPVDVEPVEVANLDEPAVVTPPTVDTSPTHFAAAPAAEPMPVASVAATPAVVSPQIVFDTEAFARVFATVIAETIEKTRAEIQSQQPPVVPPVQYSPGMQPVPGMPPMPYGQYPMYYPPMPQRKDGFWSHAKHPDVILLGIATVIVLVILAAWLS